MTAQRTTGQSVERAAQVLSKRLTELTRAVEAQGRPVLEASPTRAQVVLRPSQRSAGLEVLLGVGGRWLTLSGSSPEGFVVTSHEMPTALVTIGAGIGAELADSCQALASVLSHLADDIPGLQPQALLGLATTRELLAELKARGEVEPSYQDEGNMLAIGAARLLDDLPGSMLDYRTVDQ